MMVTPISGPGPDGGLPPGWDTPLNAFVCALVAAELDAIRRKLEDMGIELSDEPVFVKNFCDTLQAIDELSQRHENLAKLLRAPDMEAAIDSISLESLRNRMLDGVTGHVAELVIKAEASESVNWNSV